MLMSYDYGYQFTEYEIRYQTPTGIIMKEGWEKIPEGSPITFLDEKIRELNKNEKGWIYWAEFKHE